MYLETDSVVNVAYYWQEQKNKFILPVLKQKYKNSGKMTIA